MNSPVCTVQPPKQSGCPQLPDCRTAWIDHGFRSRCYSNPPPVFFCQLIGRNQTQTAGASHRIAIGRGPVKGTFLKKTDDEDVTWFPRVRFRSGRPFRAVVVAALDGVFWLRGGAEQRSPCSVVFHRSTLGNHCAKPSSGRFGRRKQEGFWGTKSLGEAVHGKELKPNSFMLT